MLDVLKRNELWNVTVVVTRYFGGILLGAGGLVRAYSSATSEALALASFARLEALTVVETELDPTEAGRIEAELRRMGAQVLATEWSQFVNMDPAAIGPLVRSRTIVDGRNALDREAWNAAGWTHVGIGR